MEAVAEGLYHPLILELNRSPLFYEKQPDAPVILDAVNPLCGDKFKIYLSVENGRIQHATFHGYGCAVSKASASVLMKKIQGLPASEALAAIRAFLGQVNPAGHKSQAPPDAETAAFLPVRHFPGRLKCATLAWEAMEQWALTTAH